MSLTVQYPQSGVAIIEMTESGGEQLIELVEELSGQGLRAFILDYCRVCFATSLDMAQVITSRAHILALGGRLEVVHLRPQVRSIFQVLKMERLFRLDRELEDILTEINAP